MNKHHEIALQQAQDWLTEVDAEAFLNDFLELQENACGPSVDEFIQTLHISTQSLFDLSSENSWDDTYTNVTTLNLSEGEIQDILRGFESIVVIKCANDDIYSFKDMKSLNINDCFSDESLNEDDFLAA